MSYLRIVRERLSLLWIGMVSGAVILLTLAIVAALVVRSLPILHRWPLWALLSGSKWQPMEGVFGFRPFIVGTLWVTLLAMLMAVPVCLLMAVYLAEYARKRVREGLRVLVDVLAGIPSVVYGLFGVLLVVPLIREYIAPFAQRYLSAVPGLTVHGFSTGYSVLAGALVLALMVTPFIVSVAEEVLRSVPVGVREASLALGATRWETVKWVTVRRALPGLIAAVVLGFARAFGETMAVLMVVGNVVVSPKSVFDPAYPLPALIANNYGEMMSIP
ncbi:MAG: phosphate ABC transporter permease subunit PstC [Candidatus Zipacnadales bacterium]